MGINLAGLDPPVAGFGNCGKCAYRDVSRGQGRVEVCAACASESFASVAADHCDVCCHALNANGECHNYLCDWGSRGFTRTHAIALYSGRLAGKIKAYKYDGFTGWATIFGRVLASFIAAHPEDFERYDYVIPSPTFTGKGGRDFDHTGLVVERAADEANEPERFRSDLIYKTAATESQVGARWRKRKEIAETQLRASLHVPDPDLVKGKRILVYDDVFTIGFTMREVALALKAAGAKEVAGIVLARQQRTS